jgi:hypothetical protein
MQEADDIVHERKRTFIRRAQARNLPSPARIRSTRPLDTSSTGAR